MMLQKSNSTFKLAVAVTGLLIGLFNNVAIVAATPFQQSETKATTMCHLEEDGGNLGSCVHLSGGVHAGADHVYELRYLIRARDSSGNETILGDTAHPDGVSYTLATATAEPGKNIHFSEYVDIVRSDLRKLSGMPKQESWSQVVLRVEPHIFDVTAGKYVTEPRTEALIMIANVNSEGRIEGLQSLHAWIVSLKSHSVESFEKIGEVLREIDHFVDYENQLPEALAEVLDSEYLGERNQIVLLEAIRPEWVGGKDNLQNTLKYLLEHTESEAVNTLTKSLLPDSQEN